MHATARSTALILLVVACTTGATTTTAAAATDEPTTVHVEGTQAQVSADLFRSYGGLLGDWWILTFDPLYESDSFVVGTGTERFVGCLDADLDGACAESEPSGELWFDFVEWMTLDPSTGALIESRCTHPITGGTDGFHGARGIVTMHAVPVDGDVKVTYEGTVVLDAVPTDAPAGPASAPGGSATDVPADGRGHC